MSQTEYNKRFLAQGLKWVNGISEHNHVDGECCPDFSCCFPDLFESNAAVRRKRYENDVARIKARAALQKGEKGEKG